MKRATLLALAVMAVAAPAAGAQQRPRVIRFDSLGRRITPPLPGEGAQRPDTAGRDSLGRDTTRAGRGRGIPRTPSREFQAPDSVAASLLLRPGFRVTRYSADSVRLFATDREIRLAGHGLVQREGSTLEADSIRYTEGNCALFAVGAPRLFDPQGVMVGEGMHYDACNHAGIISRATTDFQEGGATWYLRGNLAVDNEENRTYARTSTVTSCDLADPHYHFAARQVKWINKRLMVSRPAVLYVADVPIMWLPFIFQDMRRGRRSGLIPPQFGINDIVRNTTSYKRHVANIGYYWAMSDYTDAQITLDWYAQRFTAVNGRLRYRWLDRFIGGGLAYQELHESGGSTSRRVSWNHTQQFSLATSLNASLDYASSSRVISRNSVDPVLAVATIDSRLNYQRRFEWGQLNVGGSRTQSLDRPQVTTTFPTVSFTPNPIALSSWATWSPSFSLSNSLQSKVGPGALVTLPTGDTSRVLLDSRATSISIGTPLRLGRWQWSNSVSIADQWSNARQTVRVPDPDDSTRTIVRTYGEDFQTGVEWQTGINLPVVLQGSWNLQPSVQIVNTTGGPYLLRNRYTDGAFVSQGKRLEYSAGISPTLFGLFGGIGPVARIRHSISPSLRIAYAPAATVNESYARAQNRGVLPPSLRSDARQTLSVGLSQNLEAKLRSPRRTAADSAAADSAGAAAAGEPEPEGRKLKLLSLQSSGFTFDLEQAKKPGRNAWVTRSLSNTFSTDLLRGFSLNTTHDLFDGPVGYRSSRFDPALTSVAASFQLSGGTFRALGSLLGLRSPAPEPRRAAATADSAARDSSEMFGRPLGEAFQRGPLATRYGAIAGLAPRSGQGAGFTASLSYSYQRSRVLRDTAGVLPTTVTPQRPNQVVNGSVSFSPTAHWTLSWQTSYNFTRDEFNDHVVRLDRDLHDWRATFTFVKAPNGNFLFSFFIQLIDQPEIKFDYDQRNIAPFQAQP